MTNPFQNEAPSRPLKGKDKLGLLWAIQSFNQLVTRKAGRPTAALKRYNELKIANIEDSDANFGPPFFMLNYAIVRKPAGTHP